MGQLGFHDLLPAACCAGAIGWGFVGGKDVEVDQGVVGPGEVGGVAVSDQLLAEKIGSRVCPATWVWSVTSCVRPMLLMLSRRLVVFLSLVFSRWKLRSPRKM